MKKGIIIAATVVLAMTGLSSCSSIDTCWVIKTYTSGSTMSNTTYIWCSENEVKAKVDEMRKSAGSEVTVTYERALDYASKDVCEARN